MRFTTFFLNFSLLIICTKSLENSTISTSSSTRTTTATLKSTNITDFENSNIKKSTMAIRKPVQLPVDVLAGEIDTKSLESSAILTSISTSTSTKSLPLKITDITDLKNSNITTSTMTPVQLPVDISSGDILLDPSTVLARVTRNSEDIFPSRAKKNTAKKVNKNPREKRFLNYDCLEWLESDIIPHFLYDIPKQRNNEIRRSYTKIYPVFSGK